jgi:hypothetical protein
MGEALSDLLYFALCRRGRHLYASTIPSVREQIATFIAT